jgi:hypothetical protein
MFITITGYGMNMADIRSMEIRTAEKLSQMFGGTAPVTTIPMTSDIPILSPRFSSTPRVKGRAFSEASGAQRKLSIDSTKDSNIQTNPDRHYYQHAHGHQQQHQHPHEHGHGHAHENGTGDNMPVFNLSAQLNDQGQGLASVNEQSTQSPASKISAISSTQNSYANPSITSSSIFTNKHSRNKTTQ